MKNREGEKKKKSMFYQVKYFCPAQNRLLFLSKHTSIDNSMEGLVLNKLNKINYLTKINKLKIMFLGKPESLQI